MYFGDNRPFHAITKCSNIVFRSLHLLHLQMLHSMSTELRTLFNIKQEDANRIIAIIIYNYLKKEKS